MMATFDAIYYDAGTTADIGDYELTYAVSSDDCTPEPDEISVMPGCIPFRQVLNITDLTIKTSLMPVRYPVGFV